jgi:hypothetical protein
MKRLLEFVGDLIGVAAIFFILWAGLWAAHLFG